MHRINRKNSVACYSNSGCQPILFVAVVRRLQVLALLRIVGVAWLTTAAGLVIAQTPVYITPSSTTWASIVETPSGSAAFVSGPGSPPSGSPGSIQINVGNPGGVFYASAQYAGVRLDQIRGLAYSTYVTSSNIPETANVQFDMDPGIGPGGGFTGYQGRANFTPALIVGTPVVVGQWQSWNPMTQRGWWGSGSAATRRLAARCPQSMPCTWAEILASFPNAKITDATSPYTTFAGAFGFKVGNSFSAAVVSVDSFSIGTTGPFGPVVTSNFALAAPPPLPPVAPTALTCVSPSRGVISCTFSTVAGTNVNPILSHRLFCENDTLNTSVQVTVASPATQATITNAPLGRYTCSITAQGSVSASPISNLSRLVLPLIPLALSQQFAPDRNGMAAIFVRSVTTNPLTNTNLAGRFDGAKFVFTPIADVGTPFNLLGFGDVTGTNQSSLISRNDIDDVRVDANSTTTTINTILRKSKPDWIIAAVADFDGDGRADILWRYVKPGTNDSGVIFAWHMGGDDMASLNVNEVKRRGGAPLNWTLAGATDLDGDGRADIVWVSPANEVRSLISKAGRTWANERIGVLPVGYTIQTLGDFTASGRGSLLFKDAAGRVKVWLMDGIRIALEADLAAVDATTTFYAAGDFNGDGTTDIVWKKVDGTLVIWLMNKSIINQPLVIDNAGLAPLGVVLR